MALCKSFDSIAPQVAKGVFLAENCTLVGDVVIGAGSNIWYGTVIRGDVGKVRIGERVNVQDLSCIHMTTDISNSFIADDVSIGHGVIVHGARIEKGALIGMGSILMDNCVIGEGAIVGAGSLVTSGTVIPPRTLALGRPAKVVRELTEEECKAGRNTANKYVMLAAKHGV